MWYQLVQSTNRDPNAIQYIYYIDCIALGSLFHCYIIYKQTCIGHDTISSE